MPSIRKLRADTWIGLFLDIGVFLALELASAFVVKILLHKTAEQIAGPYLAFAVPSIIFLLLVRRFWRWEQRGPSPKQLALGWGILVALSFLAITSALFYSVVKLELMVRSDAFWVFAMMSVGSTTAGFCGAYNMILNRASSGGAPHQASAPSRT